MTNHSGERAACFFFFFFSPASYLLHRGISAWVGQRLFDLHRGYAFRRRYSSGHATFLANKVVRVCVYVCVPRTYVHFGDAHRDTPLPPLCCLTSGMSDIL